MRFKDFLINEAKMVSVDADDPDAINQIKKAKAMDSTRVANKKAVDAQKERSAVRQTTDADDPAARLKQQRADLAAKLASVDKQIASKEKRAE